MIQYAPPTRLREIAWHYEIFGDLNSMEESFQFGKSQSSPERSTPQQRSNSAHLGGAAIGKKAVIRGGRIKYVDIPGFDASTDLPDELLLPAKEKKPRAPRQKNDPKHVAAARELRDRYLEEVNADRLLPAAHGKYDVSRQLPPQAAPTNLKQTQPVHLLNAA